ncbi:phosphotransferase family protein [Lentzea rhizosphaerae]|uniref:Phosphotransferase family protein n=1 Tax=Lentzea rhizosphaerae TaxID=2041025 RepID=A0ABV8C1L0_9PSEU
MRFPRFDDYMKAVQKPDAFTTEELRALELVVHPIFQIPSPASGASAVVFKAMAGTEARALRFFTRADASDSARYDALHGYFTAKSLTDTVALPRWIDDGIRVNGSTWPVVEMPWIEGHTLNRHVDDLVTRQDVGALTDLAHSWRGLVDRLQRAGFAHGDLQHGNVLVDTRGGLRLVDFDCAWIEDFAGDPPPPETGHHNYQPPDRPWGRWMDTFPGLVIYLSLSALARRPTWATLNTDDNLLFTQQDFRSFDTPVWRHLKGLGDPQVDELALRLQSCCTPGWVAAGGLEALLGPVEVPWWQRTTTVVAGSARHQAPPPQIPEIPPPPPQRPQPVPQRPATGNWWEAAGQRPAASVPQPQQRKKKTPAVWLVLLLAVAAYFGVGALAYSVLDAADGDTEVTPLFGVLAAIVTMIVGFLRRSRSG